MGWKSGWPEQRWEKGYFFKLIGIMLRVFVRRGT